MARVRVKINGDDKWNWEERDRAIRLRLENPESFTVAQARKLGELVQAKLAGHIESGLLYSAFEDVTVYRSSKGNVGVGIGDPAILTKPDIAPRGTIKAFIEFMRDQQKARQSNFKKTWEGSRKKSGELRVKIRETRAKERAGRVVKPKKWKKTKDVVLSPHERKGYISEFVSAVKQARAFHALHPTFKRGALKPIRQTWKSMFPQISKKQRTSIFHEAKVELRKRAK